MKMSSHLFPLSFLTVVWHETRTINEMSHSKKQNVLPTKDDRYLIWMSSFSILSTNKSLLTIFHHLYFWSIMTRFILLFVALLTSCVSSFVLHSSKPFLPRVSTTTRVEAAPTMVIYWSIKVCHFTDLKIICWNHPVSSSSTHVNRTTDGYWHGLLCTGHDRSGQGNWSLEILWTQAWH